MKFKKIIGLVGCALAFSVASGVFLKNVDADVLVKEHSPNLDDSKSMGSIKPKIVYCNVDNKNITRVFEDFSFVFSNDGQASKVPFMIFQVRAKSPANWQEGQFAQAEDRYCIKSFSSCFNKSTPIKYAILCEPDVKKTDKLVDDYYIRDLDNYNDGIRNPLERREVVLAEGDLEYFAEVEKGGDLYFNAKINLEELINKYKKFKKIKSNDIDGKKCEFKFKFYEGEVKPSKLIAMAVGDPYNGFGTFPIMNMKLANGQNLI